MIVCIATATHAQVTEVKPVDERSVSFFYAEFALPNDPRLKVVVFTSYINRIKYDYDDAYIYQDDKIRTRLLNAFNQKLDQIVRNERNNTLSNRYNQVGVVPHPKEEWAYSHGRLAKGTGPDLYLSVSSATQFLLKVREKIIDNYKKKGFTVLQVEFDEYYDSSIEELKLEDVERLSSLWIEPYYNGVIRKLASPYQEEQNINNEQNSSSKKGTSNSPCTSGWMADKILQIKNSYAGYVNNVNGSKNSLIRNQLLSSAQEILSYCPYQIDVQQIYSELNSDAKAETEAWEAVFEGLAYLKGLAYLNWELVG